MKKCMFYLTFLFLFVLASCTKPEETIVTPVVPHDYNLTVETLESFFTLESSIIQTNRTYSIDVTFTPKFNYTDCSGSITFGIYYEFTYQNVLLNNYIEDTLILNGQAQTLSYPIQYSNNLSIVDVIIFEASGSLTSLDSLEITNKTYTEPFDRHNVTIEKMETYIELKSHIDALHLSNQNMITKYTQLSTKSTHQGEEILDSSDYYEYLIRDPFYYHIKSLNYETIRTTISDQDRLFMWIGDVYENIKLLNLYSCEDSETYPCVIADDSVIYDTINIKFNKMTIEKDGDSYIVKGLLKDLLNPYEYVTMVQMFIMMGLTQYIVDQATFELTLTFGDVFYQKTYTKIEVPTMDIVVESTTEETYTFDNIIPIDPFTDLDYQIMMPGSIGAVYEDTDLLSEVSGGGFGSVHYFRSFLEKGVYEINTFDSNISYELYDEDGDEVLNAIPHPYFSMPLIEIPEDGTYYIAIYRNDSSYPNYRFQLTKTEMNDFIYSSIELQVETAIPFVVENQNDLVRFSYTATQKEVLNFTITSDQTTIFYSPYVNDQITMTQSKTISVGLLPGTYHFYLGGLGYATGTLDVDVVVLPNIYSISQTTLEITENFFASPIYYGGNLGRAYFILQVTETQTYRFEMTFSYATIYQKVGSNYMTLDTIYPNGVMTLEPGTYYLSANSGFLSQGNIRYQKE